ncbi:hypothetical protein HY605_03990 [Candidatus Peregrinibacteria bacterium]|nr:hypothetical protein [Candidatus Peregrinibacteria bacterium]
MEPISERFVGCWKCFYEEYKKSSPLPDKKWNCPIPTIWGEHDIQFRLASICGKKFGNDWVHLEYNPLGGNKRVDICITDPKPIKNFFGEGGKELKKFNGEMDLMIELKIIAGKGNNKQYHFPMAVKSDARKLAEIIKAGKVRHGYICVIDRREDAKKEEYDKLENEIATTCKSLKILRILDSELFNMILVPHAS